MTNRERLVATLQCRPVDRPPFTSWLGFAPWGQTLERWRRESGIADLEVATHFALEPGFEVAPLEYGPWPHFDTRVISQDDEFVVSLDYRGIKTRSRRDGMCMPDWLSHPVKGPLDWEAYKRERLGGPLDARLHALEPWLARVRAADLPVQVGVFPWGVFGTLRDLVGAEECLLAFYDAPEMVHDIIETNTSLWLALFGRVAERIRIDHIHIWEDMSGKQGSLLSPAMMEEFMMPSYDRIAAFARARGIPLFSVDTDGQVRGLVPLMARHGVNAFMPFEVQAGNDVVAYRRDYPGLGIFGGLDKSALAGGRAAIHRELDRAERMFALGGWVAGFDHLIPPDVPWESFAYAMGELRRMAFGR